MVRNKHTKPKNKTSGLSAFVATMLVIVLALLVFLYKDKLSPSFLSGVSDNSADIFSNSEPFTYETGSQQMFALMGNNLVIASSTGLQLLDSSGNTVSREVFSMSNPAVCSSDDSCAVFDVGGKSLRIFTNSEFIDFDLDSEIISVSVNSNGYYAVAGYETGYKGSVTVYADDLTPVYKWYSGTGYVIDAAISPDSGTLAVLCVESSGSIVHLFHLDSEDEFASASVPNELAFKLSYGKDGNFCTLSEDSIHFFGSNGRELSVYGFEENYLANYELRQEFFAVVLSKYISGSDVSLISFGSDGKVLGTVSLSAEPLSLFSQGQKLLVLDASDIALYSHDLRMQKQNHVVPGFLSAVLLPRGNVLMLSSHYGEKCEFS